MAEDGDTAHRDLSVRHRRRRPWQQSSGRSRSDEPPPLPPNAELAVIGKPRPRLNGRAKVTGAARFTVDVALPGMLHGAHFALAAMPHARVRAIDASAAAAPSRRARHRARRAARRSGSEQSCAMSARRSRPSPPFRWPRPKRRRA